MSFFSLLHNTIVLTMKVNLYWMSFLHIRILICILISCIFLEVWKNGKHIVLVWFHLIKFTVSLTNLRHTRILTLQHCLELSPPPFLPNPPSPPQKKKNYHNNVYEYMYIIFFCLLFTDPAKWVCIYFIGCYNNVILFSTSEINRIGL